MLLIMLARRSSAALVTNPNGIQFMLVTKLNIPKKRLNLSVSLVANYQTVGIKYYLPTQLKIKHCPPGNIQKIASTN